MRVDKSVVWTTPHLPIIPAMFHSNKAHLETTKAASTTQVRLTINQMALAANLAVRITPHNLRSGSARDVAHATRAVASALGHTQASPKNTMTAQTTPSGLLERKARGLTPGRL